jgi:hypothetical protein
VCSHPVKARGMLVSVACTKPWATRSLAKCELLQSPQQASELMEDVGCLRVNNSRQQFSAPGNTYSFTHSSTRSLSLGLFSLSVCCFFFAFSKKIMSRRQCELSLCTTNETRRKENGSAMHRPLLLPQGTASLSSLRHILSLQCSHGCLPKTSHSHVLLFIFWKG